MRYGGFTYDDKTKRANENENIGKGTGNIGLIQPGPYIPPYARHEYDTEPTAPQTPNYGTYDPTNDDAYQQALAALQTASQNAPSYNSSYDEQLRQLYDQIVNRGSFSYDINGDELYRQYAEQYRNQGNLAMRDTMGQAAALTGGYGSSYGQSVGQQQYDAYLQRLNDVVPELYQAAYGRYQDEGNRLAQQYSMMGDLADQEYGRYMDAYNQWLTERNYAQGQADTAYQRGYQQWADEYGMTRDRAEDLAAAGDFSGYEALYGEEAARHMEQQWIAENPDLAYRRGMISGERYKELVGSYPPGYKSGSGGNSGNGENSYFDQQAESYEQGLGLGEVSLDQAAEEIDANPLLSDEEKRELLKLIGNTPTPGGGGRRRDMRT